MKKLSILLLMFLAILTSCKKTPEVNMQYVDVEREVLTIGQTNATFQCDYQYISTLKSAKLYYGIGDATNYVEMRVVQSTLYAEISGLNGGTTYHYYYEFANGFNSMQSEAKTFVTESVPVSLPTVITANITEITSDSAIGGGEVTNDGGSTVTARGICWSTLQNPTINDSHTTDGTGIGVFTSNITDLTSNTTYHVRAYATNDAGTAYGLDKEFTTNSGVTPGTYEYVDLNLPSGTLWATCNVGANSPEEYGDYFAWGETTTKNIYNWDNYQYSASNEANNSWLTKYCYDPEFGYNSYSDTLTVLQAIDDAATVNWGDEWCMPTADQWRELIDNTSHQWITQNGVRGYLISANSSSYIFLPAAGDYYDELSHTEEFGGYWSSSLYMFGGGQSANLLVFFGNTYDVAAAARNGGYSVRPVRNNH